jgi:hypothetical protein
MVDILAHAQSRQARGLISNLEFDKSQLLRRHFGNHLGSRRQPIHHVLSLLDIRGHWHLDMLGQRQDRPQASSLHSAHIG